MMTPSEHAVLVVDDDPGIRLALRAQFIRERWTVQTASTVQQASECLRTGSFQLVLCDVRMGDGDGFEVLRQARKIGCTAAFLFVTAHGTIPDAVRAMQGGAVDYMTKPVSFEQLLAAARRVLASGERRVKAPASVSTGTMVGRSRALQSALARAQAAAQSDADVLIEAESGTGKELLARMIHDWSPRHAKPFVAVNCAALPEALLESELFGHARGAFTGAVASKAGKFEVAAGGTLLLDEIGDMPLNLQPKLLRVLQERVVERLGESRPIQTHLRVIASTNVHLLERVGVGSFRSDLFYRLNVIPLSLPPLRERLEDVPLLARHCAARFAERVGTTPVNISPCFLERLSAYSWPGNVRELSNFMQRVLSLTRSDCLSAEDFDREHCPPKAQQLPEKQRASGPRVVPGAPLSMDQVERTHLQTTLELVGGNRTRAAEMLGISVRTMRNKIRQYDLPPRRYA